MNDQREAIAQAIRDAIDWSLYEGSLGPDDVADAVLPFIEQAEQRGYEMRYENDPPYWIRQLEQRGYERGLAKARADIEALWPLADPQLLTLPRVLSALDKLQEGN